MAILDLFSKRQKRLRGELTDVYQYDAVSASFRVQVVHIWRDAFGEPRAYESRTNEVYRTIHDMLAREYGLFVLSQKTSLNDHQAGLIDFFLSTKETEKALDAIELTFTALDRFCRDRQFINGSHPKIDADSAIAELNDRFRENGIGYQFESGQLIRVDSTVLHADIVKPALVLLAEPEYAGANAEYRVAHEHYRHGRYKESLNDSLKAFESTLKVICKKRSWSHNPTDTAKKLLDVCFAQGLLPPFLQSQFAALRTLLESGIPTVRNKVSGHGQGSQPQAIPQHVATYGLHLAGSSIVFVVNAEKLLP
ncbi:MAG TPA: hypothetical protein VNM92_13965 [Thermoanaerobaculia bacterium]|nr:hypothetical protein [Thermoanaerobaculia bacterium]